MLCPIHYSSATSEKPEQLQKQVSNGNIRPSQTEDTTIRPMPTSVRHRQRYPLQTYHNRPPNPSHEKGISRRAQSMSTLHVTVRRPCMSSPASPPEHNGTDRKYEYSQRQPQARICDRRSRRTANIRTAVFTACRSRSGTEVITQRLANCISSGLWDWSQQQQSHGLNSKK